MDLLQLIASDPAVDRLAEVALRARRAVARGSHGSSTHLLAGALARLTGRPVLLMVAHVDDADEAADELVAAGVETLHFPALEALPSESTAGLDLLAERLSTVQAVSGWATPSDTPRVLVAPIQALMQSVPAAADLGRLMIAVQTGQTPAGGLTGLVRWLDQAGYKRTPTLEEPGDYALRGGILDIFPPGDAAASAASSDTSLGGVPIRLDFFGDQIDKITEVDLATMGSDRTVRSAQLVCAKSDTGGVDDRGVSLVSLLPPNTIAVLHELLELTEQARGYYERVTRARGIFGPPAVFKLVRERLAAAIEVTAIGQYASAEPAETVELPVTAAPTLADDAGQAVKELGEFATAAVRGEEPLDITVHCQNAGEQQRLGELITEFAPPPDAKSKIASTLQYLHAGFVWTSPGRGTQHATPHLALPYSELLHRFTARRRTRGKIRAGRAMDAFLELAPGDFVVHTDYGIAKFIGLQMLKPRDAKRSVEERLHGAPLRAESEEQAEEHLTLEFAAGAKLHVPVTKIDLVQKYIGGFKGSPPLSTIGGQRWQSQKARVADSVKDLAAQLLRVRAARESLPGVRYPADTAWQKEFEAEFPYQETEDQLAAIAEIKKDMLSARPMDRLLCGDVGYGKTELAIRAAFKAVEYGKQVAVLVPTTVLAEQHERTFKSRFAGYPFRVESISRWKTDTEVRDTLKDLAQGKVDVCIGTHRLLSKDVQFADLGLVVIDEEQRFGVEHKERLLALRMTVDVLTLSATPIPRTLHMSMLGLRDISSLTTAPLDRRAVVTEVIPYNAQRLKQAIDRELAREGQVFYVHNRVHDITSAADDVQKLAPTARIVIGHGQMADGELEDVMLKFIRREADILVSTTIIESGIDIATANTMIIDDADRFGLAELHQLRGRVGRYKHRAYCYLLLPNNRPLKETAKKRLQAIEQYSMLGAGFKIAMRDLEIRGAGNILGPEQSGHIAIVGYDMYCRLLDRAVKELKNEVTATPSETALELGVSGSIPKTYIPSDMRRMEAYRRTAVASTHDELAKVRTDLAAAYGPIPDPTERLLQLAEIRIGGRFLGVRLITTRGSDLLVRTTDPQAVAARFQGSAGKTAIPIVTQSGDLPEVFWRPDNPASLQPLTLLAILRKRLGAGEPPMPAPSPPPAPMMPAIKKPSKELKAVKHMIRQARREGPRG
ncbi:MAG: transcription-repair coupling factor [Phycisphaerales bacterium]